MNWLNEYNELVLCNRWPKYWSFSFSISQSFQWINRADFLWGLTGCCHELFSSSEHYLPCIKRDIWMNWYLITSSKQCAKNTDVRDTRLKILNKQTNKQKDHCRNKLCSSLQIFCEHPKVVPLCVSFSWSFPQKFRQEDRRMKRGNCSSLTEFILWGITDKPEVKIILFIMFVIVYLINLLANLGMIILIRMDPQLHTPMYFFLSHLSFCDLCYSTAIGPKMLVDLLAKKRSISFYGCALQFLVFSNFIDCECLLLAMMAYDRYKAISSPLLYAVSISSRLCSLLIMAVYLLF